MGRIHQLLYAIVIGLVAVFLSCGDGSDEQKSLEDDNWRLIIRRADGHTETVLSADPPYQCTSTQNPKVLYFCGTGVGDLLRGRVGLPARVR